MIRTSCRFPVWFVGQRRRNTPRMPVCSKLMMVTMSTSTESVESSCICSPPDHLRGRKQFNLLWGRKQADQHREPTRTASSWYVRWRWRAGIKGCDLSSPRSLTKVIDKGNDAALRGNGGLLSASQSHMVTEVLTNIGDDLLY